MLDQKNLMCFGCQNNAKIIWHSSLSGGGARNETEVATWSKECCLLIDKTLTHFILFSFYEFSYFDDVTVLWLMLQKQEWLLLIGFNKITGVYELLSWWWNGWKKKLTPALNFQMRPAKQMLWHYRHYKEFAMVKLYIYHLEVMCKAV